MRFAKRAEPAPTAMSSDPPSSTSTDTDPFGLTNRESVSADNRGRTGCSEGTVRRHGSGDPAWFDIVEEREVAVEVDEEAGQGARNVESREIHLTLDGHLVHDRTELVVEHLAVEAGRRVGDLDEVGELERRP